MGKAGDFRHGHGARMLTTGASAEQRLLQAIRRHYLDCGCSPSWRELHLATGIPRQHIGRELARLVGRFIVLRPGVARGIELIDRMAMFSDLELELAVHARGGTLRWPEPIGNALVEAFPLEGGPDWELGAAALLQQIDRAEREGAQDGASQEPQGQDGHTGAAAPPA